MDLVSHPDWGTVVEEEQPIEVIAEEPKAIVQRPVGTGGKVGFFPTISGPFHIGHAWCYVAAGLLARKIGAKLHLNCTLGSEYPRSYYARQVGLLTSLILPDEIAFIEHQDKANQLSSGRLLRMESEAIKTALANGEYEIEIQREGRIPDFLLWSINLDAVVYREKDGAWYDALFCPHGTDIRSSYIQGIPFEYFIQRLYGVTISIDGMDLARTMLPHWKRLAYLLGEDHLYWDARFMPMIVDPQSKLGIGNSQPDKVRQEYWTLERWIGIYGEMGLLRLFWAWMQDRHTGIPGTLQGLVEKFDLARVPWTTEEALLEIEVDQAHICWFNFAPDYGSDGRKA